MHAVESLHASQTPSPRPARGLAPAVVLALCAALAAGCTMTGLTNDTIDYGEAKQRKAPLDVPPDLTQLARDPRYVPESGTISASRFEAAQAQPTPTAAAAPPGQTVAPSEVAAMRIERDGNQRWLVTPMTPEQAWPKVREFWERLGMTLVVDQPEVGVMETEWAENRAKIPQDLIRRTIGRVLEPLYSTGERDKYRTRIERSAGGTEIFISHRGMEEVYASRDQTTTVWQPAASDPDLEAEMLSRLRLALAGETAPPAASAAASGAEGQAVQAALDPAAAPAATVETPARARVLALPAGAALQVDEGFDRAWRRVGLALDRGGFTVEDRDRSGGLYYVRYVDPADAGKEEPGFFSRLFGGGKEGPTGPLRYRIAVKSEGEATTVSVLDAQGAPEAGPNGKRIVDQLVRELR